MVISIVKDVKLDFLNFFRNVPKWEGRGVIVKLN